MELHDIDQAIAKDSADIDRYRSFNSIQAIREVDALSQEIRSLEAEIKRTLEKAEAADQLQQISGEIGECRARIAGASGIIENARSFEQRLGDAQNARQRKMIHIECKDALGEESPRRLIGKLEGLIRRWERDLKKTEERYLLISKRSARDIRKIVVDGNNMCYEGRTWVGIEPLLAITKELCHRFKIIVVFDAVIRRRLGADDKKIRDQFNDRTTIHIVASRRTADETILDIASNDGLCYVLSNDRYAEYKEKEVVKRDRLIRHEIVNGRVMIHDLNFNVRY